MAKERRKLAIAVAAVTLATAGCGNGGGGDYGGKHPNYAAALTGSPAPLAALHRQADQLLPGGTDAYQHRIASLAGYPVVVNVWASWCGPCRYEFPTLQKLSAAYGKRVAFLGVNFEDSESNASEFLAEAPVPYPSYTDPDKDIAHELGATGGVPDTAFYDRAGDLCYLKQGPYTEHSELESDLRRYALAEECESG